MTIATQQRWVTNLPMMVLSLEIGSDLEPEFATLAQLNQQVEWEAMQRMMGMQLGELKHWLPSPLITMVLLVKKRPFLSIQTMERMDIPQQLTPTQGMSLLCYLPILPMVITMTINP